MCKHFGMFCGENKLIQQRIFLHPQYLQSGQKIPKVFSFFQTDQLTQVFKDTTVENFQNHYLTSQEMVPKFLNVTVLQKAVRIRKRCDWTIFFQVSRFESPRCKKRKGCPLR